MEGPLATCAASKMIKEKDPLLFEKIMAYNRNCEDESLLQ